MSKVYLKTFGCQMNKNDSAIIGEVLQQKGFEVVDSPQQADVLVVNTCSVRQHAEDRAFGYISTLRTWHHSREKVLAIVGCMAMRRGHDIMTRFPFVDVVLGPDSYRAIAEAIAEVFSTGTRIVDTAVRGETYCGIFPKRSTVSDYISIMRGCDNFCSYCVVPYVRGRARSRPLEDICKEIELMIAHGVKDIMLLGQNVNEYEYRDLRFFDALRTIARIPGLVRLRFLTSHPKDLDQQTIEQVRTQPCVCEWFHLPIQAGSDRILDLMNRHYTREGYLALIAKIRNAIPTATISTDVIVGFPTETEEDFQETLGVLAEVGFDDAYMYRYSVRTGTKAALYPCLPEKVILERLARLITFQGEIIQKKTHDMVGKTFEVLCEGPAKGHATRARTRGNKDIVIEKDIAAGTLVTAQITGVKGRTPVGVVIGY